MTDTGERSFKYPANAVRICIDQYTNWDVQGRIYCSCLSEPLLFSNCGELLLKTDSMFDQNGFPQSYEKRRCFKEGKERYVLPPEKVNNENIMKQEGHHHTFDVIVESRKRSNWQGILFNRDRSKKTEFRSEMQLINWIWKQVLVGSI